MTDPRYTAPYCKQGDFTALTEQACCPVGGWVWVLILVVIGGWVWIG